MRYGTHGSAVAARDDEDSAGIAAPAPAAPTTKVAHAAKFESFLKKMGTLLAKLKKEQQNDDEKKAYCEAEMNDAAIAHMHKAVDAAKVGIVKNTPINGTSFLQQFT